MQWLVIVMIGAVLGLFARFVMAFNFDIKTGFCLALGLFGALAGGVLFRVSPIGLFGPQTFYIMGALVALAALVGGILARTLTSKEKRI